MLLIKAPVLQEKDLVKPLEGGTMSDEMKTYRQALRDIPASNTVYKDVNWPNKPN